MWGVGVWSKVSILIHPTGVLWDSGHNSGLASPFLEPYCPQTIPSQTLIYDGALSLWYMTVVITELVFYHRQYATGQNVLVSFRVYISMQYYERAKYIPRKTPSPCNAAASKFHSWHYICWHVSFSRHSPHPNLPIGPPHGIVWFITPNHTFPVVHCPVASLFTPLQAMLSIHGKIFGLWAAAHPWNPMPLNSQRTVIFLAGQFVALQNSPVIVSLDWRVSRTTFFNAWWYLSVVKHGLPSYGFVVVVPSLFHSAIMSPAADMGSLRRVAMALTYFLPMWQPVTGQRSKSLSSPDLPILLVLLSNEQHTAFCLLLYR
jgi:hypothetical protein